MMPLRVDLATVMDGQEELMESEPETNEPPAGREKGIKNRDFKRAPPRTRPSRPGVGKNP